MVATHVIPTGRGHVILAGRERGNNYIACLLVFVVMSPPADERGPPETDFSTELAERLADAPTDDRVYRVALELVEPTRVATVADRADCSKTAARRHLDRLADIGLLTRVMDDPAAYRRNESYFEWRRFDRLVSLSEEESTERLRSLLAEHAEYRDKFEVDEP